VLRPTPDVIHFTKLSSELWPWGGWSGQRESEQHRQAKEGGLVYIPRSAATRRTYTRTSSGL